MAAIAPHRRALLVRTLSRYPLLVATILVGVGGGLLWLGGFETAARYIFTLFCLIAAGFETRDIVLQVRRRQFGVDILAVIAIISTIAVGEVIAAMIIVLMVTGGKALENYAESRAQRELTSLLNREPQTAHRIVPGTTEVEEIDATAVVIGDAILMRSGDVVPVDGILASPSASFDQSSLTGESIPVSRSRGDLVLSGSINGNATATITATALARDSQFQAIVGLVKQAAENRAPVVRLADRYAVPFTALALVIATTAWIVSGDPVRFAEVLVLATPCPLVLAAPVAFMGGMSRAARAGIIVKGGSVLEQLARVRTAVFDKTGTLTRGEPTVSRVMPVPPWEPDQLLALAASAELLSSHVLASSVVHAARERQLVLAVPSDAREVAAQGVQANIGARSIAIGTQQFARTLAPDVSEASIRGGELAVYVVIDGKFAGTIVAADSVRANARSTVEALAALGITKVMMLTGDAESTADNIAALAGISSVRANCLAADKVAELQRIGDRPVLMVGDGVNDAPVLASAEVGIAMGARGATAASESAAAVILVDDISRIVRAVVIGRETVRIALQSMWVGMALSVVLMLIASFGVIPATAGAGIQELVDLAAILNALRALHPREHFEG
jgi:heavy metal translocating P-type ATPase